MSTTLLNRLFFSVLMSGLMAFLVSAWVTFINLGSSSGFVSHWISAFILTWPVGFTVIVISAPTVQRLAQLLLSLALSNNSLRKS